MLVHNSYDQLLQESKSDSHLVGSAWSVVSIIFAGSVFASVLNYFI